MKGFKHIKQFISSQTEILDDDKRMISAVDYYFIQEDGSRFKVSYYSISQIWIFIYSKPNTKSYSML